MLQIRYVRTCNYNLPLTSKLFVEFETVYTEYFLKVAKYVVLRALEMLSFGNFLI